MGESDTEDEKDDADILGHQRSLGNKHKTTGVGAETSLDVDDIMSKEANDEEGANILDTDADQQSSPARKI